jgi:hypothetical protein
LASLAVLLAAAVADDFVELGAEDSASPEASSASFAAGFAVDGASGCELGELTAEVAGCAPLGFAIAAGAGFTGVGALTDGFCVDRPLNCVYPK